MQSIECSSVVYSTNRIWDKNNHVQINTDWYNNEVVSVAIKAKDPSKSASNDFAITVIAGQNPYLTYNWTSDTDLANQIKKTIAYYHTHELSNPIQNDNNILTQDKDTKGAQLPDGSVTVTHEEKIENGVVTRTYHVKISNPEVELDGAISPLGVSASGFTMPDNIRSYSEDVANAEANKKGNFGGTDDLSANTSNETLKKALEDTDTIKVAISNESETTSKNVSGVLGSPWFAKIGYSGSNLGPNGDDPSNYITTKLIFKDDSGNVVGPSDGFKFQGKSGTTISFNGVEQELVDLINQGYNIDHVASKSGNTETTISPSGDKNKISSYNFGNISTASATPDEFIVYLKASHAPITDTSKKVTETVHYIFQDENGQVLNTPTRDDHHAELDFTGTKPYGSKDSDPFTYDDGKTFNAVTIDPQLGFKLISAKTADGTDVLDGNSVKALEGINHNTPNVVVNVIFQAQPQNNPGGNPQPSTPDKPVTPVQPSTPNTPETPVVPTTPDVPGTTPETPTTNPEVPGTPSVPNTSETPHKQEVTVDTTKVSETPVQNIGESTETKQQGQKLPQTSNQNGSHLALAGLAVTAIASLFGITGERKRKGKN